MRNSLPVQLTSFIGRRQELVDLRQLLMGTRLLTLTGPGGAGKTRLAVELARLEAPRFAGNVAWVELVSLSDEKLVGQRIASTLDVLELPGQDVERNIIDFLGEKQLLLLLDNCEHLVNACARIVDQLLRACPGLKVVATSLEPLRVSGESAWPVPALELPPADPQSPEDVIQYEAARLFVDRVRHTTPGFELTSSNSAAVSRICRRLDGLPLAIELAASRADMLTPQQIAERLDDRFGLLRSRVRTSVDPRHQTLQATIDWSYQLLTVGEQTLLRRCAIFENVFSLSAAEATCSGGLIDAGQVFELLSVLVARSLVIADTASGSEARYRQPETIRAYSLQQLQDSGEHEEMMARHLASMLVTVREATPTLVGAYQKTWFAWLESQEDDIRAALRFALQSNHVMEGLQLIDILGRSQYWAEHHTVQEWLGWLASFLDRQSKDVPAELLLASLTNATSLCGLLGNSVSALAYGKKALVLAEKIGDETSLARTLNSLARAYATGGDYQMSFDLNEQAVSIHRQQGSLNDFGYVNLNLALDAISLGLFERADEVLEESMALARQTNQALMEAHTLNVRGELEFCREDFEAAYHAYETSLPILQRANAERDVAALLLRLGFTHLQLGDQPGAGGRFDDYRELQIKSGNNQGMSEYLTGYGALALKAGQPALSGQLLAAAESQAGAATMAFYPTGRYMFELYLAQVREKLGEQRFRENQAIGRRLSLDEALSLIEEMVRPLSGATEDGGGRFDPLTQRQREIAKLVAQGMSNGQIAAELVLSKRTVEKHVANILAALDLENRAQIVRWVLE